jgi:PilZ domain
MAHFRLHHRLRELRQSPRHEVHYLAQIDTGEHAPPLSCVIANISETGAKLTIGPQHSVPDEFVLVLRRRCRVVRQEDGQVAVQFVHGS